MLRPSTVLYFTFLINTVAACEWGKHGENCDKRCSENCQVNLQRNLTHCNKETGECSDGCITGWYAAQCDQPCSKNCLDNVCNHGNGQCAKGCIGNLIGDFCEITEDVKVKTNETTELSTAHVAVIITISLVAIIVIIVVTVIIKRRRQRDNGRGSNRSPTADTDHKNTECVLLLPTDTDHKNTECVLLLPRGRAFSSSNDETKAEYAGVMERDLLEWEIQKEKETFEETAIYNTVKGRLEHLRHVTISGASGEGKTSMALMLGSEYQEKGYELYFVDNISEFKFSVLSQGKDQCFIFDDIFGKVEISTDSSQLIRILDNLNSCLEQMASNVSETLQINQRYLSHFNHQEENRGNIVIIFTTKPYNLEQGVSHLGTRGYVFFKGTSVIDLTQTNGRYTMDEKKRIFLSHKHCNNDRHDFDLDNICGTDNTFFGFPLTCKLFFSFPQSHAQYQAFFKAPLTYLRRELESLLKQNNNKSAALILMLLCDSNLNLSELEVKSNNQVLENHLSTVSGVVHGFIRSEVATCVRNFFGTYFKRGDITSFSHPAIYDACAFVYFKINPAFVLKHCSMKFLCERVQAQAVPACETDDDRHVIYVSDAYNDIIASRLAGAVREVNYRMSIMHSILKRQDILDKVLGKLKLFMSNASLIDEYDNTIFHYACFSGNENLVKNLIPYCDVNNKGADGVTPIMIAVKLGLEAIFYLLVSEKADLTVTDDYNDTVLHLACQGGNRSIIENLLPSFDINCRGQYGWTALMVAAVHAKKNAFELLVSKGADLTLTDDYNDTVLHLACRGGNMSIIENLLPSFDINSRGLHGWTAVMKAAVSAKKDAFELLIVKGADLTLTDDYNDTVLHLACRGGNRSIIEYLLPSFDINSRGLHGRTAVMKAAVSAKKDAFDLLVSKGADLTLTDDYNDTVLHLACEGGNRSIIEYLLPSFDINSRGQHGWTAVMRAAVFAKKDAFDLLVSKGADLTLIDDYNDTALHLACEGGNRSIVEHLLPMCDINCRGQEVWTLVMTGACSGNKDTFDLLLSKGANTSLTGDDNETLLHAASEGGNTDIVRHVIADFDINTRGCNGHTPLMHAVCGGHTDVVDFLVDHGADVNMVDNDGDSLLHLACEAGNVKMAKHVRSYSDFELRNMFGWTPVAEAAVDGNFAVFKYLKIEGAHLTLFDKTGDDLATLALQGGCRAIGDELGLDVSLHLTPWNRLMKSLVKSKMYCLEHYDPKSPDLVQTDQYGDSLLHLACRGGNRQCVEYLLPSYDINVRGRYGWTPVMMAAVCAHYEVFQLLVSQKADLTLASDKGEDMLTLARRGKNDAIVKFLLEES